MTVDVASLTSTEIAKCYERCNPLVAIVTPVYNGERFLGETMECVQASDYPNLVHVVLDNASTDRTPEIIRSFQCRRIPVLSFRNSRVLQMGDNFNKAVSHVPAEAKYFRVLCADDLMAPTAITKTVAVAERDQAVTVVGCICKHVELFGTELPRERDVYPGSDVVRSYFRGETHVFCGNHMLFRRSAISPGQPFFDARLKCDDTDAAVRESLKGKFGFVHEELAFFRIHDMSDSTAVHGDGLDMLERLILLDRYAARLLPPEEFAHNRRTHRRIYLRRSILTSLRLRDPSFYRLQMRRLDAIGDPATTGQFIAALLEWTYKVITGQRRRPRHRRIPQL